MARVGDDEVGGDVELVGNLTCREQRLQRWVDADRVIAAPRGGDGPPSPVRPDVDQCPAGPRVEREIGNRIPRKPTDEAAVHVAAGAADRLLHVAMHAIHRLRVRPVVERRASTRRLERQVSRPVRVRDVVAQQDGNPLDDFVVMVLAAGERGARGDQRTLIVRAGKQSKRAI